MGVVILVRRWLALAVLHLRIAVAATERLHELGASRAVDQEDGLAPLLAKQERFDSAYAGVNVVRRCREGLEALSLEHVETRLFIERTLGHAAGVTHHCHRHVPVALVVEARAQVEAKVLLKPDVRTLYFLKHKKTAPMIKLANSTPWVATKILSDNEWATGDRIEAIKNVKIGSKAITEDSRTRRVITVLRIDIPLDPVRQLTASKPFVILVATRKVGNVFRL